MEEHDSHTQGKMPSFETPEEKAAATPELTSDNYLEGDVLNKHLTRQAQLLNQALEGKLTVPTSIYELSCAYEKSLFSPSEPPKKQANGTCEANPRMNFYPTFIVPETLATYHIFFKNQRIPLSCRANRSRADEKLILKTGDKIPLPVSLESVKKIFEGLGDEETVAPNSLEEKRDSILVELKGDNPRLAVLKRNNAITHFAYPALSLPPKVMSCVMENLIIKKVEAIDGFGEQDDQKPVVSDEEIARWLKVKEDDEKISERRKTMLAVTLVSTEIECMRQFFTSADMIRKIEETLHYTFKHGYVKLASKISNVELPNLVSYLGILHENRLGQSVLHSNLEGEARRDYIRDTIYLFLIHCWQTAMGVWQQFLEDSNLKELKKILTSEKKTLWSGFDELSISKDLAKIIFPTKLLNALQTSLPDFTSQSMIHNFRSFILERSGLLPSLCCALPSDFVPLTFKECPPPLWSYTYLFQLANYFMFHTDIAYDVTGDGLLDCYCRCNLCTPHRSLVTNTALLNEVQTIGTFEIQGPVNENGTCTSLKLTPGMWTSAYLKKFEPRDYHPYVIKFYEDQSNKSKAELTACVITQSSILAQLQDIKKAREEFLLKKGHGVYLDPHTGEELNTLQPNSVHNSSNNEERQILQKQGQDDKHESNRRLGGGFGPRGQHRQPTSRAKPFRGGSQRNRGSKFGRGENQERR